MFMLQCDSGASLHCVQQSIEPINNPDALPVGMVKTTYLIVYLKSFLFGVNSHVVGRALNREKTTHIKCRKHRGRGGKGG